MCFVESCDQREFEAEIEQYEMNQSGEKTNCFYGRRPKPTTTRIVWPEGGDNEQS